MNSIRRYQEDTTLEIPSLINIGQSARVIRSHRRPPTYSIRKHRKHLLAVCIVVSLGGTLGMPDNSAARYDQALAAASPIVEAYASDPEFESLVLVLPAPDMPETPPVVTRNIAPPHKLSLPQRTKPRARPASRHYTRPTSRAEVAIRYALAQQGDRYVWNTAGPNTFDCSGLVLRAFAQIGVRLPHYTGAMIGYGKRVSRSEMRRGDIVFPASGHVGIYLGNNKMVHASSGRGRVVVAEVYSFYAARRLT